nr:copper chaperone [Chitinophagaceae bacterium]
IQRAQVKISAAKCVECKPIIESTVPKFVDGLVKITVVWKKDGTGYANVAWYPDRTNIEEIKTAIANAGFDADDVTANPESEKKLPACCRKAT